MTSYRIWNWTCGVMGRRLRGGMPLCPGRCDLIDFSWTITTTRTTYQYGRVLSFVPCIEGVLPVADALKLSLAIPPDRYGGEQKQENRDENEGDGARF
jgi:hypothetical protein